VENPDIDAVVRAALADPSAGGNPIEMTYDTTKSLLQVCL
jgi:4-hydroxybutyrate dehydrogenase